MDYYMNFNLSHPTLRYLNVSAWVAFSVKLLWQSCHFLHAEKFHTINLRLAMATYGLNAARCDWVPVVDHGFAQGLDQDIKLPQRPKKF